MFGLKFRKIRGTVLFGQGVLYRLVVICVNAIFNAFFIKVIMTGYFADALVASITWNLGVNMPLYYAYHYPFARLFKLGKKAR